jgi:hypothetical protein
VIWRIEGGIAEVAVLSLYAAGRLIVLLSTSMINHFDLFGLCQVFPLHDRAQLFARGISHIGDPIRGSGPYQPTRRQVPDISQASADDDTGIGSELDSDETSDGGEDRIVT